MGLNYDTSSLRGKSSSSLFGKMSIFNEMIDNEEFIKSQYDLLGTQGKFITYDKEHAEEAMLVLDKNSELDDYVLYALGLISEEQMSKLLQGLITNTDNNTGIDFDSVLGTTYRVLDEVDYYVIDKDDGLVDFRIYGQQTLANDSVNPKYDLTKYYGYLLNAYNTCTNKVKIVGVIRLNNVSDSGALSNGVAYSKFFTQKLIDYRNQKISEWTAAGYSSSSIKSIDLSVPSQIAIYINSFESKDNVKDFIDKYNAQAENNDKITYTDYVDLIMSTVSTIINAITYALIAFVSVSLIVSSIMIGIITYISVIERTKEIGVLRSVGASKKDIKRVFTAESFIIGLSSGVLGIVISLILILPINLILKHFTNIANLASLPVLGGVILIVISVILTFISGLIPAKAAAKKDPVIALREN